MKKNIPYGRQQIDQDDCKAVLEALQADYLTQGPKVVEFERDFAAFVGSKYAIAVNNGTAALHLGALALGVNSESRILVAGNSFAASANCVLYCGGQVEFCDISSETWCLDIDLVAEKLKAAPFGHYAGIIVIDYAGFPSNTEKLRELAARHKLWIMEDACHAPGARFRNSEGEWAASGSGRYADIGTFSFHPVKHLTTGEGGMITTNDKGLYEKILKLRTHGITKNEQEFEKASDGPWYHEMQVLGFNYRLPDLNCALGVSQLKKMPKNLARRQEIASIYFREFQSLPLGLPFASSDIYNAYHLFVVRTPRRDELFAFLKEKGIQCQVHYIPIYQHPFYRRLLGTIQLPQNDQFYLEAMSLPMYHSMADEDVFYVVECVKKFFSV